MSPERHSADEAPSGLSKLARAGALALALATGAGCATHSANSLKSRYTHVGSVGPSKGATPAKADTGSPITDEFNADIAALRKKALDDLTAFDPKNCIVKSGGSMPTEIDMGATVKTSISCPIPVLAAIDRVQSCANAQFESKEKDNKMTYRLSGCLNEANEPGTFGAFTKTKGGLTHNIGIPSAKAMKILEELTSATPGTPVPEQVALEIAGFRDEVVAALKRITRKDCTQKSISTKPTDPSLPVKQVDTGKCLPPFDSLTATYSCKEPVWTTKKVYLGCKDGASTNTVVAGTGFVFEETE